MTTVKAALVSDLPASGLLGRVVGGRKLLLVRAGGAVRAYEDRCAHLGLPLSGGRLSETTLYCPAHEWEYDACTGRGLNPATACLKAFPVTIENDEILVDVG